MKHKNPKLRDAILHLKDNPDTYTVKQLASLYQISRDQVWAGYQRWKDVYNLRLLRESTGPRPHILLPNRVERKRNTENVLVIPDLHGPFILEGFLEWVLHIQKKYKTTATVFIGDLIDAHASSFHTADPDGLSPGHELQMAIDKLQPWIEAFPVADVCIGNHDLIVARKAHVGAIPSQWIRSFNEVLGAPGWEFRDHFIYDNVKYAHGVSGTARNRARKDLISTVQGHLHHEAYVEHIVGENFHIFGMQVGTGIDRRAYAFNYGKSGPKPAISCGVILNHGRLPIVEMAQLDGGIITTT